MQVDVQGLSDDALNDLQDVDVAQEIGDRLAIDGMSDVQFNFNTGIQLSMKPLQLDDEDDPLNTVTNEHRRRGHTSKDMKQLSAICNNLLSA